MATKSEDIKLQLDNVKHKKSDGTLYLMAERLAWMPNTKNNFTISHKYSDIKVQKISPEGKAKIQLQIVLHTGDNTTFQFNNLEDRTAVKDALLLILPQFKGKMPKDRERKALLLGKNPHLLQLYKDLVETKIVSAEDFWSQFVEDDGDSAEPQAEQQDVGVSANFLTGIPLNGKQVKGTVTVETLYAILKTYPKVAKKHQDLVPTKMSETEFWNKFFQSRYFNRDRTKDMFSDCFKSDEREWTSSVKQGIIDPFIDIDQFDDNSWQFSSSNDPPAAGSSHENPDQVLIKRFNQQSIRLLDSLKQKDQHGGTIAQAVNRETSSSSQELPAQSQTSTSEQISSSTTTTTTTDSANRAKSINNDTENNNAPTAASEPQQAAAGSFRANRRDWTYDDLAGQDNNGDYLDDQSRVSSRMHEVDREMYSVIPKGLQSTVLSPSMVKEHFEGLKGWEPHLSDCLAPSDAFEALKNLSPAGLLMRSSNTNRLVDTVPEETQTKLKSAYYASNELLRHFWLCFPAVEPSLESKLMKIYETIKKFETSKLQPFYDSLPRNHRHLLDHLMRGQFNKASRKFETWKNLKRQRETVVEKASAAKQAKRVS